MMLIADGVRTRFSYLKGVLMGIKIIGNVLNGFMLKVLLIISVRKKRVMGRWRNSRSVRRKLEGIEFRKSRVLIIVILWIGKLGINKS